MPLDNITVYTVITTDYNVVRKLSGQKGSKVYIVIIQTREPRRIAGLLSGMRRYYNIINVKKGEPIIL